MSPQRVTVLVVEDEAAVRRLVSRALASLGFSVLEADNGASALRLLADQPGPVHLVISDIHMPVMDGLAFVREFRLLHPEVPVLFITGREPSSEAGEVLPKPFGPEALQLAVTRILGRTGDIAQRPH